LLSSAAEMPNQRRGGSNLPPPRPASVERSLGQPARGATLLL